MNRWLVPCVALALTMSTSMFARSFVVAPRPFIVDTTLKKSDSAPPLPPLIRVEHVFRGEGLIYLNGGIVSQNADGGSGSLEIVISAGDGSPIVDRDVGYRFHFVDGRLPSGLGGLPGSAWMPDGKDWKNQTWIAVPWDDGRTWKQDAFSFRMFVTAIDRAGNESEASNVVSVAHDGNCDDAFEELMNLTPSAIDVIKGIWTGKDDTGAKAKLSVSGHQFNLVSGRRSVVGFAQVWTDADGKGQIAVDTESDAVLTGPYQIQADRLHLRLGVAGANNSYDLRRAH